MHIYIDFISNYWHVKVCVIMCFKGPVDKSGGCSPFLPIPVSFPCVFPSS